MAESKQLLFVREFLNKPGFESTGFIFAEVEENETWMSLSIGDCSRQITLSFNIGSDESAENAFYKVDLLVDTLKRFRQAMQVNHKQAKKMRAERERLHQEMLKRSVEEHNTSVLELPGSLARALRVTGPDDPPFAEPAPARRRPRRRTTTTR